MKKVLALLSLAPFTFGSMQAFAADKPAPKKIDHVRWSGFHIGLGAAYQWANTHVSSNFNYYGDCTDYICPDSIAQSSQLNAALGVLEAGYDYELANTVVVGFGGEFNFGSEQTSVITTDTISITNAIGNTVSANARVGYSFNDKMLAYGLFGISSAEVKEDYVPYESTAHSYSNRRSGLTTGAGVEAALTDAISLKLEYRYTPLDDVSHRDEHAVFDARNDVTLQSARAVVSYRF